MAGPSGCGSGGVAAKSQHKCFQRHILSLQGAPISPAVLPFPCCTLSGAPCSMPPLKWAQITSPSKHQIT
eukprot:scaffold30054_cov90-Isochrysis_galbana.AAC.1